MVSAEHLPLGLVCPVCHASLELREGALHCEHCRRAFPVREGIPDFRDQDEYWCNVSREKMRELKTLSEKSGDWLGTAQALIPEYLGHFESFARADLQFLWPCTKESRILDAGSMWGGLTIPVAQYHGEVYAVDKTLETLSFLNVRAAQMGHSNVYPVASLLGRLPFPDGYFDLAILSGVLEWVAFDQDVILEEHWGRRRSDRRAYTDDPRSVQVGVLRELGRVLKPGGALYLAIENSVGFTYLMGRPDDHVNLRFVSFLPRRIANAITRLVLGCDYRTYVYSIPGYRSLLRASGLESVEMYGTLEHYISPGCVFPLSMNGRIKRAILEGSGRRTRMFFRAIPWRVMKQLVNSVMIVAKKRSAVQEGKARIVALLEQCGVLDGASSAIRVMKWNSRSGNSLPINFLIFTGNDATPTYFCRVGRSKSCAAVLEREARSLESAQKLLRESALRARIPQLLYCGTVDGVPLMVTNALNGRRAGFAFGRPVSEYVRAGLAQKTESAIRFLGEFQTGTRSGGVRARSYLESVVQKGRQALAARSDLRPEGESLLDTLLGEIDKSGDFVIPMGAVHGDFDFFFNILLSGEGVQVVDFEHFEECGVPFLDLGALVFTPLLVSREHETEGMTLSTILRKGTLQRMMSGWMSAYAQVTEMPFELLRLLPPLTALEAQTRVYPSTRDPESFPLRRHRSFFELLRLRLSL